MILDFWSVATLWMDSTVQHAMAHPIAARRKSKRMPMWHTASRAGVRGPK